MGRIDWKKLEKKMETKVDHEDLKIDQDNFDTPSVTRDAIVFNYYMRMYELYWWKPKSRPLSVPEVTVTERMGNELVKRSTLK